MNPAVMLFYNPVLLLRCGLHVLDIQRDELWAVVGSKEPRNKEPLVAKDPQDEMSVRIGKIAA